MENLRRCEKTEGINHIYYSPTQDDIINKINEIVDYINSLSVKSYYTQVDCSICRGTGNLIKSTDENYTAGYYSKCFYCNGTGKIIQSNK